MKTLILKCYCCGDDLSDADKKFCAKFDGKARTVCFDCGMGIINGTHAFSAYGVTNNENLLPDMER